MVVRLTAKGGKVTRFCRSWLIAIIVIGFVRSEPVLTSAGPDWKHFYGTNSAAFYRNRVPKNNNPCHEYKTNYDDQGKFLTVLKQSKIKGVENRAVLGLSLTTESPHTKYCVPVPSPRGVMVDLAPSNKVPRPPKS